MADEPDVSALQAEIATLKSKIKEVSDEAKGHRLNADNFRRQAEDARKAADTVQQQLAEAQTTHAGEIERQAIDLKGRATAAEAQATEAQTSARNRVMMADLRVAARETGMHDMDGLKLLDLAGAKLDDDGNLTNGTEMMAAMKEAKPYLFGQAQAPGTVTGTTTSTLVPPRTAAPSNFNARTAPAAEFASREAEYLAGATRRF